MCFFRLLRLRLVLVPGAIFCLIFGCHPLPSGSEDTPAGYFPWRGELCILWYNAENLFHPSDAQNSADDPFTAGGERHWTIGRYERKLTAVARIIVAAGRGSPPEIVGLAEIEEARVLEDLVAHPILRPYEYAYLHREGPDHRGMEVACLIRGVLLKELDWRQYSDPEWMVADSTRAMLGVRCTTLRGRELELVFLHFLSRYRGAGASAPLRKQQMQRLCALLDSLYRSRPNALLVAAGDFNAEPADWSIGISLPVAPESLAAEPVAPDSMEFEPAAPESLAAEPVAPDSMEFEPAASLGPCPDLRVYPEPGSVRGTYRYRGQWSMIDYFLVGGESRGMSCRGWVLELPALLSADENYGGEKPLRTYQGYSYCGGPSDHLPVVLDISW